jgi:sulfur carrier protein
MFSAHEAASSVALERPFRMSNDSDQGFSIQLNGVPYSIDGDTRLLALVEKLNIRRGRIAIELNQSVVPKAEWARVSLKPGDKVEIVNFVGGG